jgi:hypothetical protein
MKSVKFATIVDAAVLKEVREYAKEADKSLSGIVTEALAQYVAYVRVRPAIKSAMDQVLDENEELLKRLAR